MIDNYIQYNVDNLIKLEVEDMFDYIHTNLYKHVDISFRNDLLEISNNNNGYCYIEHNKLKEYDIIKTDDLKYISDLLYEHNFKNNIDFEFINNKYILSLRTFKTLLLTHDKYLHYYFLIEKVFYNYNKYQKLYYDKIMSIQDEKLDYLINLNNNLVNKNNILVNKNNNLDIQKNTLHVIDIMNSNTAKLDNMHNIIIEMKNITKDINNDLQKINF